MLDAHHQIIGVMSGTSFDGVDAVLLDFDREGHWSYGGHATLPYPDDVRAILLDLPDVPDALHTAQRVGVQLAHLYADTVEQLITLTGVKPTAIACHGQTVLHDPEAGFSCQLGHMPTLAARLSCPVIFDFRNHNVALGGQGAPLAPLFHEAMMVGQQRPVAVLNLGGVANITCLSAEGVVAGDLGPCNILLDGWIGRHLGERFDRDGQWAARGQVLPDLLDHLLRHPFCHAAFPKSTGRDTFSLAWLLDQLLGRSDAPEDVQRTLVAWLVILVEAVYQHDLFESLWVCGGGAYNSFLMGCLSEALSPCLVQSTVVLGISPQVVEGAAFAWLGYQHLLGQALDLTTSTGVVRSHVVGCYCPAP